MVELLTRRLNLRPVVSSDVDDVYALLTNPIVRRYLPHPAVPTQRDVEVSLRLEIEAVQRSDSALALVAEHLADRRVVGQISIWARDQPGRDGELTVLMHPDVHGRGLATEACEALLDYWFDELGRTTAYACVDPSNASCIALMQRLGFRFEGPAAGVGLDGPELPSDLVYSISRW